MTEKPFDVSISVGDVFFSIEPVNRVSIERDATSIGSSDFDEYVSKFEGRLRIGNGIDRYCASVLELLKLRFLFQNPQSSFTHSFEYSDDQTKFEFNGADCAITDLGVSGEIRKFVVERDRLMTSVYMAADIALAVLRK